MKLSKVLLGSALVAAVVGFAGCKNEDDPNGMISGSNKKYSIDFTNETDNVSRGYKDTAMKHSGGTVRISFDAGNNKSGVMGFIFGLEEEKGVRNFNVIGFRKNNDTDTLGNLKCYVSQFTGVTDLQGDNFGVNSIITSTGTLKKKGADGTWSTTTNPAELSLPAEQEFIPTWKDVKGTKNADGTTSVIVFVECAKETIEETEEFVYNVYALEDNGVDADSDFFDKNGIANVTAKELLVTVPTGVPTEGKDIDKYQKKLAVYANVYPTEANTPATYTGTKGTGTMSGNWTFIGTKYEAAIDED